MSAQSSYKKAAAEDEINFVAEAAVSHRRGLIGHRITMQSGLNFLLFADPENLPVIGTGECFVPEIGETISYYRVYLTPHLNT